MKMNETVRQQLFGAVFLVMGLLQFILFMVPEPVTVNLVLGVIFSVGGLYFFVPAFLPDRKKDDEQG